MTNSAADPATLSATGSPRRSSHRSSEGVRRVWPAAGQIDWPDARLLASAIRSAGPPLLFGVRLWASVSLALHVAFWLELDNAFWAGTSAAIVCQPRLGASLRKGWFRMIGTVVGAVAIVVLSACFPQARAPFLVGLALWGAACALVATLLRNFAAYAAALAGYTAAIVASDTLGATGGTDGQVFMLAITRATEICIGADARGALRAPLLGRVAHEGEQALARLLEAGCDRPATELPLGQERLAPGQDLARGRGVHQVAEIGLIS
jgi:uncharacterized membrane protein YccC